MRCVISDAIEKVFVSFFYYLGYRRFVSRVQILPTAATQKIFKALPLRCSGETHQELEAYVSFATTTAR